MIRPYTCFACNKTERHNCLPTGWYSIKQSTGNNAVRLMGAGLFCSIECVCDHFYELEGNPKQVPAIAQ